MTPDTFTHEGIEMEIRPTDGRYICIHSLVEDVPYEWFIQTGGDTIAIPVDEPSPMVVCGRDLSGPILKSCIGKACKHYKNIYLDEGAVE